MMHLIRKPTALRAVETRIKATAYPPLLFAAQKTAQANTIISPYTSASTKFFNSSALTVDIWP